MEVDLGRQLKFPLEICTTTSRPDVVLLSAAVKSVLLIELRRGLEATYEIRRPGCEVQGKRKECKDIPGGGGSQRLCRQFHVMPAQGRGEPD